MKYIDVSEHQGVINWDAVRGHVDGVILRAGFGHGNIDAQFSRNAAECKRLGIPIGAYWFSYAYTEAGARYEAEALLTAVRPWEMELPLAFDWEYNSEKYAKAHGLTQPGPMVQAMTNAFCQTIEAAGYWCMVYSNPDMIGRYFGALAGGRYDLWLANWPKTVDVAKPPRTCGIWQWGGSSVPGINGNVDTNEAYKDYATMLREKGFNGLKPKPVESPKEPQPWYAEAMAWAKDNGIMDGTRPEDTATRAEVAQMLFNLQGGGRDVER